MQRRRRILVCAVALAGLPAAAAAAASLVDIVARTKTSVLAVGTFNATASPRFGFRGTGFVVGDGNLLITNAHVLPTRPENGDEPQLMVLALRPGAEPQARSAKLVALDAVHDLALLRFEGPGLPTLPLSDPAPVGEGQSVAFIGFPIGGLLGFTPVTHRGIIASVTGIVLPTPTARQLDSRAISRLREGSFDIYQLDAVAYPGNSGGPLLNADTGEVIGVINMVLIKGTKESALSSPTGITYAIPVRYVRALIQGAR